jgi:hypothetical protein
MDEREGYGALEWVRILLTWRSKHSLSGAGPREWNSTSQ